MGKAKPVVRERSVEKSEENKAAKTGVGKKILLPSGCCFSGLCGLGKLGHVSVTEDRKCHS